ncbi:MULTISPECIES: restriction endonuclease subunit S [unclassified Eikenella]|uniref:restriction endonuclease subunit S n=1 Tax=unclassified Eikenella TaxID=2639367 RepID=UPI0007E0E29B|nr:MULTISPECIES: restriction endonuclease subunit S [unclassified Eikenella]OAM27958.1 restriction endonuclease subunit S [Eikenella sp. NML01-A-086]OAM42694.1 restriction endonuclease subunit S [Eikenella sp. NML97-A-109]
MKEYLVSDVINIFNGRDYSHLEKGTYPLYGSGGLMSYISSYLYDGEAILLPRKGTLNNIMYVNEKFWTVDTMYYATVKPEFSTYYIYAYLAQLDLAHLDSGSALPSMTKTAYNNIKINLPDFKIQQSIAAILSALDKKIALNKQINARLEEMAKTLYDYWFVQFDFPDANGKPYKSSGGEMVFDETLKREIPKGWAVKSLNQVADIVMGQSPDGASYNLEQEGTIFFQGSTDFDWRFPNVRQYTTSPTRFAQKGDILLSVRAPVGDLNISPFECCIGRGLAALRSKSGNNSFLFYVMKYFKTVFERRNTEGTTFGSITKDDLHSLKLAVPADKVLEKYNEISSKYDEMIFIRSQQNHQLTQLRDFLLPMLMNGQISVTCSGARDG